MVVVVTDSFEEACNKADAEKNKAPAKEDWRAKFSRLSNEALAKAEEKKSEPKPDEKELVKALARTDRIEYDRMRAPVADEMGIRVGTLDAEVEAARAETELGYAPLPHWVVEAWPEEVEGDALLDAIRHVLRRFIVLPAGADIAIPLWILHAWTFDFDEGEISPFLVLVSPTKRCGKTSLLIVLKYLTLRSELASNISPSAIFRYVDKCRPTLLMDEADSYAKDNEEMRGILNAGHTREAAYVIRNVGDKHEPKRFSTWAPKAIATIQSLADTLEDRSVIICLQRKSPAAKVDRLRRRDSKEFKDLRSQAARWAADNRSKLSDPDPQMPDLNDRAADNWRPLLAIADLAGGEWPARARVAAGQLSGETVGDDAMGVELLKDVQKVFGELEVVTSADVVAALVADPERPWATWVRGDKPLTPNTLARLLKPFHIVSETVHPAGRPHAKGYKRAHFEAVWAAYLPGQTTLPGESDVSKRASVQPPVESAQVSDFQSVQEVVPHGSKNTNLSNIHAVSHACTFQKLHNGGKGHSDQESAPTAVPPDRRPAISAGPDDSLDDL